MSKNITIQQDGTPISFSASAIETPLVGRGTTDWQPEDEERMAKVLVRKNGTYSASGINVPGIVEATVKLAQTGAAIEVTQRDVLGPVQPVNIAILEGDSAVNLTAKTLRIPGQSSGYERFLPALTGRMGEKTINREGTYKAANDGYYAYSKLTVNISGGGGGGGGGGGADIDHIAIVTPPTKTEYVQGETMDYSGIAVQLKKSDGTTYTDASYPDGRIPFSQLQFPVAVAPEGSGESGKTSHLITNLPQPIYVYPAYAPVIIKSDGSELFYKLPAILFGGRESVENLRSVLLSETYENDYHLWIRYMDGREVQGGGGIYGRGITIDGKTAYASGGGGTITTIGTVVAPMAYVYDTAPDDNSIWTAVYGEVTPKVASIPVQWVSVYDGQTLEATFDINVIPAGGNAEE